MTLSKYLHCNSKANALCGAYEGQNGCNYRSQCAVYLERVNAEAKRQQLSKRSQEILAEREREVIERLLGERK